MITGRRSLYRLLGEPSIQIHIPGGRGLLARCQKIKIKEGQKPQRQKNESAEMINSI